MKIAIVSGSVNCLPLLQFLKANTMEVFLFPGKMEEGKGDFEMIRHFCRTAKIAVEGSLSLYEWLSATQPDMVFVLGFRDFIDLTKVPPALHTKLFNIHFGALPDFRGPNPVFWQLKNGVENVSMSIHRINDKFDDGPVVWSKQILNEPHFTFGFLELLFGQVTIEGIAYIINQLHQNGILPELQKDNSRSHYYKRPELKDVMIGWTNKTATDIVHLINACNPWNKGATSIYKGSEVKIIDAGVSERKSDDIISPGTIIDHKGCLEVSCIDKNILSINMLNINGTFLPARFADKLGFVSGGVFTSSW